VEDGDTPETLAARILVQEHRIYPEAVAFLLTGAWRIDGRRCVPCEPVQERRAKGESQALG